MVVQTSQVSHHIYFFLSKYNFLIIYLFLFSSLSFLFSNFSDYFSLHVYNHILLNSINIFFSFLILILGEPTIALRTRNWEYFSPSPFKVFTPVAYIKTSNLTFSSPALAGSDVVIYLTASYSVSFTQNDIFDITLPTFWSSSSLSSSTQGMSKYQQYYY